MTPYTFSNPIIKVRDISDDIIQITEDVTDRTYCKGSKLIDVLYLKFYMEMKDETK